MEKWSITFKVLPLVALILVLKLGINYIGWDFITLSLLFNSIISANMFLLGFLLAGTFSDYKESERLPGELAASIETIYDEIEIIYLNTKSPSAKKAIDHLDAFSRTLMKWFYKKEQTEMLRDQLSDFNAEFHALSRLTEPAFIVRLKQEQHSIRRNLIRIHTIRGTSFVAVGYAVAEITTTTLVAGLLFAHINPSYESVFFVGLLAFLMIYIIALIKELDNPFEHYKESEEVVTVSLKPLVDFQKRLKKEKKKLM